MAELTDEERARYESMLTAAEDAMFQLRLGHAVSSFSYSNGAGGRSKTFVITSEAKLQRAIDDLKRKLGLVTGSLRPIQVCYD